MQSVRSRYVPTPMFVVFGHEVCDDENDNAKWDAHTSKMKRSEAAASCCSVFSFDGLEIIGRQTRITCRCFDCMLTFVQW